MPDGPRLRMFGGPNGSGKSTLNAVLGPGLVGLYVNADDIEREIRGAGGVLDLGPYRVAEKAGEFGSFVAESALLKSAGLADEAQSLLFDGGRIDFSGVHVNSYYAAVAADFIRQKLIEARATFTFETVMSSVDKVDLLCAAKADGYRTYLYFVATDDPAINVGRVAERVAAGGHDVPTEKIVSRYERSLANLRAAVRCSHRAYIFDNSGSELSWLAEVTDGSHLEYKQTRVPPWFDAVFPRAR